MIKNSTETTINFIPMSTANNTILHPSFTLKKLIDRSEKTQQEIALRLDMSEKHLSEILNWKKNITPDTALKLEQVFWGKASFWINLQAKHDEALARQTMEENIKSQIPLLERFKECYSDLAKLWYVPSSKNKEERVQSLLSFFEVTSLANVGQISQVAFRKSSKHVISDESVASWLRVGELMAKEIEVAKYDPSNLDFIIWSIREFTNDVSSFGKNLINLWKEYWIKFIFVPRFSHAPINGATRWINWIPVIQLSDMWKKFDRIIFTLFHELWHVALHPAESFLDESVGMDDAMKKELDADNFAQEKLIPSSFDFKAKANGMIQSELAVVKYAKELWIDPSILAWRLQRETWSYSLHHKLMKQVAIQ
jgi:HTH-type transcriptional regulator / antitoxin HigA